jgi:hypothetical protein
MGTRRAAARPGAIHKGHEGAFTDSASVPFVPFVDQPPRYGMNCPPLTSRIWPVT